MNQQEIERQAGAYHDLRERCGMSFRAWANSKDFLYADETKIWAEVLRIEMRKVDDDR